MNWVANMLSGPVVEWALTTAKHSEWDRLVYGSFLKAIKAGLQNGQGSCRFFWEFSAERGFKVGNGWVV